MRAWAACWLLLALLAAQQCTAIRSLGGKKEMHLQRPVHRWGRKGTTEEKTYTIEQMGRAGFDPEFAAQASDVDRELVGLEGGGLDQSGEDADAIARLREIFPLLDTNHDNYIDLHELATWHAENGRKSAFRRNEREFNRTDTNKDGKVSLQEYLAGISEDGEEDLSLENVTEDADFEDWLGTIKTAFKLADTDGDGQLNVNEYFEFQNPEEGNNERLKLHVLRQDIYLRDDDRDQHLSFQEFKDGYWSSFYLWETDANEKWDEQKDKQRAQLKFISLDLDSDNRLDASELRAVFDILHPNESAYARLQAQHMMEMADTDGDGRLTLQEALQNVASFYAVVEDPETNDYSYHDEL